MQHAIQTQGCCAGLCLRQPVGELLRAQLQGAGLQPAGGLPPEPAVQQPVVAERKELRHPGTQSQQSQLIAKPAEPTHSKDTQAGALVWGARGRATT